MSSKSRKRAAEGSAEDEPNAKKRRLRKGAPGADDSSQASTAIVRSIETDKSVVSAAAAPPPLPTFMTKPSQEPALSSKNAAWLAKCPNPAEFVEFIKDHFWAETKVRCPECGDKHARKDMRRDDWTPYASEKLTCRHCWDFYGNPEEFLLDPFAPDDEQPVAPKFDDADPPHRRAELKRATIDGILWDTKINKRVGVVQGYNPLTHSARRVTLDAFGPGCTDHGHLEHHLVVKDATPTKLPLEDNVMDSDEDEDEDGGGGEKSMIRC